MKVWVFWLTGQPRPQPQPSFYYNLFTPHPRLRLEARWDALLHDTAPAQEVVPSAVSSHHSDDRCHPLSSPFLLPSIFPSMRAFSNKSALHIRWPKYWSFSFSISPSNEYSELFPLIFTGLISLLSKEGFSTTVQKKQFFSAQLSLRSSSHIYTRLLEKQKL